ncbi:MAG: TetR/AcrR family transcriptional regulator [Deltaproteobacteria bacterium]|nr:TetR/AcrR family transcriptional regulator [Nannocystaceae bacterium]
MTRARPKPLAKPRKKTEYHHEDLRRALLDAAIVHLRHGDVTALTMQLLARAAGVSPGAPYHHFADKVAVLAALAEEGFALWLTRAEKAIGRAKAPHAGLGALARTWLDFATSHPSHYRVMFLPDIADRTRFATLHETSGRGLSLLVGLLGRCVPGASKRELLGRAVTVWSTLHGFASLKIAGVLGNIPDLPALRALEDAAVTSVVASVLPSVRAPR